MLSQSIKLIKKDKRYFCLLTYADQSQNHTGIIYRASNWEYLGLTKPIPQWINKAGQIVAKKATITRTNAQMIALGLQVSGVFPKHKFRIILPQQKSKLCKI